MLLACIPGMARHGWCFLCRSARRLRRCTGGVLQFDGDDLTLMHPPCSQHLEKVDTFVWRIRVSVLLIISCFKFLYFDFLLKLCYDFVGASPLSQKCLFVCMTQCGDFGKKQHACLPITQPAHTPVFPRCLFVGARISGFSMCLEST